MHKFLTALRPRALQRIERIGRADLIVGIPCFNNDTTVTHVIQTAGEGLARHFKELRCVLIVADGGSTDDSREAAEGAELPPYVEKIVTLYRGLPGKGSAMRLFFEAMGGLGARGAVVLDSDLRSIRPEWIRSLARPLIEDGYDFVAPIYTRYKYDGTITNNIAYNLCRALFGRQVRQPIGGDFGFSGRLATHWAQQPVWESDIARFGIDIWMTISAIMEHFKIGQAPLGTKIHDAKDPVTSLGPMFRQVVGTLFSLIEHYDQRWPPLPSAPVPVLGQSIDGEAEAFPVDLPRMIHNYKEGFEHFNTFWREILDPATFEALARVAGASEEEFHLTTEEWAKVVYEFAATFHRWSRDRSRLVDLMCPIYYARVASFMKRTAKMTAPEAETVVEEQAEVFERLRGHLVERWAATSG